MSHFDPEKLYIDTEKKLLSVVDTEAKNVMWSIERNFNDYVADAWDHELANNGNDKLNKLVICCVICKVSFV